MMFQPPQRYLMGPGPAPVAPSVLQAQAQPTIGHLDPAFVGLMDEIQSQLRQVFHTENAFTMALSAPATAAMEACLANVLEAGDRVLICVNGVFGVRLAEMARRCGAVVETLHFPWGRAVSPSALDETLQAAATPFKLVAWVQAETSTGALSDSRALAALTRAHGALSLVDCVTAIAGVPIEVDAWGLDMVYAGTQKCLGAPPGLAPVTISERALAACRSRTTPVQTWFADFSLLGGYWGEGQRRVYHHTAPVNALYGLHEALRLVLEEGLEARWARHRRVSEQLVAGLADMDIEVIPPEAERLPPLTTLRIPEGVDDADFRRRLLERHHLEVGAGLGELAGKAWRIGLMGHGCNEEAVQRVLAAMREEMATPARAAA
jgi:alanine-glyoxylate transaminase / serine-glyoxylate transaminase / serine-pyruvate transaminase